MQSGHEVPILLKQIQYGLLRHVLRRWVVVARYATGRHLKQTPSHSQRPATLLSRPHEIGGSSTISTP